MRVNIRLKNIIILTIAGLINAFGVTVFLAPVKLYDSGISGTSMILSQLTPPYLSLSVFLVLLNIPLSVYAVFIYSLGAFLITDVLPINVSVVSPLAGDDLLLCALFGGVISGVGSGLTIRFGGAIDGIEVMAVIFAKRIGITVGTFVMIYNVILYIICGIAIGSFILPLYSILTYGAALKTIDFIVEGINRAKAATIITDKAEPVCAALSETFGRGLTISNVKGYYSDSDKSMIYFVVNRFQISKMRDIVHSIDSSAFISITEVADVFGQGQQT